MMLCVVAVNTISDVYSVLNIVDTPLSMIPIILFTLHSRQLN